MKNYQEAYEITTKLLDSALRQNERYFKALRFYACKANWEGRDIVLFDQGKQAVEVLEINKGD